MPGFDAAQFTHHQLSTTSAQAIHAEDVKLYLPSELSATDRRRFCTGDLAKDEDRVCYAEACDSLENLRHHLRTRSFTNKFKIANVTGQIRNMRARQMQSRIDEKVRLAELQYRRAREALMCLRGPGDWEERLRPLEKSDVRALNEHELTEEEKDEVRRVRVRAGAPVPENDDLADERQVATVAAVGEGHRRPSWIWFTGLSHENEQDPLTKKGGYIL